MKQLLSIISFILISFSAWAQMPKAINYQAVARNSTGQLLSDQTIKVRLSIVTNAPGNPALYSETRNVTTNSLGLFNLKIGAPGAISTTGNLAGINWINNTTTTKSLKAEIDFNNSGLYNDLGTQSLASVPYAFAADEAFNAYSISGNYVSAALPTNGDVLTWNGSVWIPTAPNADSMWVRNGNTMSNYNSGNIGIGTSTPLARLHVADSNVLFTGTYPTAPSAGPSPVSGPGTRMMWYADKGAFRAGSVFDNSWDQDSVGTNSFALGYTAKAIGYGGFATGYYTNASGTLSFAGGTVANASGDYSISFGNSTLAKGSSSVAMGSHAEATGEISTAFGGFTKAPGIYGTALGWATTAKGYASAALGNGTQANGFGCFAIGRFNDTIVPSQITMQPTTPLFIIGNGTAIGSRANAMVVRNDGRMGLGVNAPGGQFELSLDQGRKPSTNTWTITSDARLKNIEGSYTKGLKEILQLKPIQYHYKNTEKRKFSEDVLRNQCVGFSAQDVQKVFPECVGTDDDGYLNLNTHAILIAYANAIQELNSKNEQLTAMNNDQQVMLMELSKRIQTLEKK